MLIPESGIPIDPIGRELRRAERLEQSGQWQAADACYAAAITLDNSPASRTAFATSLAARERYNEAICQLTCALDVASSTGDRDALGTIFHNFAAVYRDLGDPDLARRFQQRAIQQMDDCGPIELMGLANDAWLSGRSELAACLAASCSDLDDETESVDLEAQATLAVITGLTDNPREGIRTLIQVIRQHRIAGAERLMGIDLMNLSVLLAELGWYRAELAAVRNAIDCFERASATLSAARARHVMASLERMQSLREFDPRLN